MEDDAVAALHRLCLMISGKVQAIEAIQDAIISSALQMNPGLAETLANHLTHRYDFVPGQLEGVALNSFQNRFQTVLEAVRAQRR